MKWDSVEKELGIVKPNTKHVIRFQINQEISGRPNIQTSCVCSNASYKNKILKVTIKIKELPKGIYKRKARTWVQVTFKNKKTDKLFISYTLKR